MIETGLAERVKLAFRQANSRGNQVGIKTQIAGGANQLRQVFTRERFAAGEAHLHAAHCPRLAENVDPLFGGELPILPGKIQRVRAVGAL